MTKAEAWFWTYVRGGALENKCLRQHIIGQYIVDFLFRKSQVIVEIDGAYHFADKQQQADAVRQEWLERMGYKVLRFTNEQVLYDTEYTINTIKQYLLV